jgi:outer membrane lipoprotein-sorting protein
MTRRFRLAFVVGVVFLPNGAIGQQLQTASELMSKVHDAYHNLNEYRLVATLTYRDPEEGLNLSGFTTIAVRKPDKARWELRGSVAKFFTGAALDTVMVLDGKSAWTYAPKLKQYKKEDDPEPSESIGHLEEQFLDYGSFTDSRDRAKILRKENLHFDGSIVECYVVEVRNGLIDVYRLWVDSKRFLVLREDKESKDDSGAQYYSLSTVFSSIELRRPVDSRLFAFSPPADSKRVLEIHP